MSGRAELASAIQNLRTHCNIIIRDVNILGPNNVPGFHTINELLKRCDAVFRAFNTDVTLDRDSAGEGGAASVDAKELETFLINACQLFDGWHADCVWSEWDEDVRYQAHRLLSKLNGKEPLPRTAFTHIETLPTPAPQAPFSVAPVRSCYICKEPATLSVNVAPDAASGGVMQPVCQKHAAPFQRTPQAPGEEGLREILAGEIRKRGLELLSGNRLAGPEPSEHVGSVQSVLIEAALAALRRLSPSADLLAAAKEYRKVAWPWMDKNSGNPRLTYDEWCAICDRLDRAIRNAGGEG